MLRLVTRIKSVKKLSKPNQCLRKYTTDGEKSGSAKVGLIVGSSVVVFSGLTIGYAKYDSEFRRKIEKSIPYSDRLFDSMFGPTKELLIPNSELKDKIIESSFMSKKKERTENQLNKSVATNGKKEDKNKDISNESKPTTENIEPKIEIQDESKTSNSNDSNNFETFSPKEEDSSDSDGSQQPDIDLLISSSALKEQLMNVLPVDGQEFQGLQQKFNDLELEYQRKITQLEEKFEIELKRQLKRQLSAFNEHLSDQMSHLRQQLKRNYDNAVEEKLLEEKNRYNSELSNSFFKLQILDQLLKARDQLDSDQYSFRKLWVLCQTLRETLNERPSLTDECLPISLKREISDIQTIIRKEFLDERPVVRVALESIPKEVLEVGVYTQNDLIKRFTKVNTICRRVALIGDEGGSLYRYLLSYIQSLLVFRDSKIPKEELENKEVDPSEWDTFDILTRVSYHLSNNNLEQALRYANQLKGEPRNVAKDWIKDTRSHLEFKQAVDLLQNLADSINVQIIN